uniref:Olfactory receptor n=1 Tax=Salarias fasciatus TaxID=181472 RepID=A0A672H9C2_SALFA
VDNQPSHFTLSGYFDVGLLKYLCFVLLLCLYLLIVGANLLLILVICVNRTLHEPMYLFLLSLFVNELYGSSGLFPLLLVQVLSDSHTVSAPLCFLQIFSLHCYGAVEYVSLAVMSYDRYLAICHPLRYGAWMSCGTIGALIAAAWLYGVTVCVVMVALSSSLRLCGNVIHKVYCDNFSVVKLACADITAVNIHGIATILISLGAPLAFIFYTYFKILAVCVAGSRQTRQKAVSTCAPHLTSVLHFTSAAMFELLQGRFDMTGTPLPLRVVLSLYWFTCQPLLNPLVYGLSLSKIRLKCTGLISVPINFRSLL